MTDRPEPSASFMNAAAVLDRLEGDLALLREVIGVYLENYPRLLSAIRTAISSGNPDGLFAAAHALKSAVGTFEAPAALEAVVRMEAVGRGPNLAAAPEALERLEAQLAELERELRSLLNDPRYAITTP